MLRFKTFTGVIIFFLTAGISYGSEIQRQWLEKGDAFFRQRAEGHDGDVALASMIERALSAYIKAYEAGDLSEELAIKILDASYFYAAYSDASEKRQKEVLQQAIKIGEYGLKRYPDSVGINYWMAGIWGRWGEVNGIFASAKEGVAGKIKIYAENTIAIDPKYAEGGGYRALGRLHFKAPKIPFFLSWPSKKEALKFLKIAVYIGPDNTTNHLFYAESLYNEGLQDEALKHIDIILHKDANQDKVVEILRDKKLAETLKNQILKTNVQTQNSQKEQLQ